MLPTPARTYRTEAPVDDHTLFVATVRWALKCGWVRTFRGLESPDGQTAIESYLEIPEVGVMRRIPGSTMWGAYHWHRVDSVRQAVDVLCAYRVLPVSLSSGYDAGMKAALDTVGLIARAGDHIYRRDEPDAEPPPAGVELEPLGGRHG